MIKTVINKEYEKDLGHFIHHLPEPKGDDGEVIHDFRNILKVYGVKGYSLNVKYFRKPNFVNQVVYSNFRKSKAQRSYENGLMLFKHGFLTPIPIAYIEDTNCRLLKRSAYICMHEKFDGLMQEFRFGKLEGREKMVKQFAQFTADLHNKNILHLDYSSGNILYKKNNDSFDFYLVDLNRMTFDKPIDADAGCHNLRRLWGSEEMFEMLVKEYAKNRNFDETAALGKAFKYRNQFWKAFARKYPGNKPYLD